MIMKQLKSKECTARRRQFMKTMGDKTIAVIPAAEEKVRSRDTEYMYRQNSDFLYLTGFNEPDSVLVLIPGRPEGESVLFCRPKDKMAETWSGRRLGPVKAVEVLMVDQAFPIDSLPEKLLQLVDGTHSIFYSMGQYAQFDQKIRTCLNALKRKERQGALCPSKLLDIDVPLHAMRVIKSDEEIAIMERACNITAEAHRRGMKVCKPNVYEYHMEAEIQHEFIKNGARVPAYNSIVASGENACTLHYCDNNRQVNSGDLVLIDAGCELNGYAADITRTFPADGRFTPEQKVLYSLVLKAQLAAIEVLRPGESWNKPQDIIVRIMTEGLVSLGILSGKVDDLIESKAIQSFYMHGYGHFIGLDVHDVGVMRKGAEWITFMPGMVLTVEPGLYISSDDLSVDAKWRGMGIRIEDNVLITEQGHRVLSASLEKEVDAIEQLMNDSV